MKIIVLGITGSIGTTLVKNNNSHKIVGCVFKSNIDLAKDIINKNNIPYYYSESFKDFGNVDNLDEMIKKAKPDLIVNAVSGMAGLDYSITTIQNKVDLALANKESLVIAGKFIKEMAKKNKVNIFPIDSEHSSLYEMIKSVDMKDIKRLIITCSGGSCYNKTAKELRAIKFNEVIKHPNWSMGEKISFDSATLINKCFEIVEAYHLFGIKNIKALYHKQSIVHSMIEFNDNSIWSNISYPDMALSIDLALNKFKKQSAKIMPLNFYDLKLEFDEIDAKKWKPISWAYNIIEDKNNSLGLIINFANEYALKLFKQDKIKFIEIYDVIEGFINKYKENKVKSIEDIKKLLTLMEKEN